MLSKCFGFSQDTWASYSWPETAQLCMWTRPGWRKLLSSWAEDALYLAWHLEECLSLMYWNQGSSKGSLEGPRETLHPVLPHFFCLWTWLTAAFIYPHQGKKQKAFRMGTISWNTQWYEKIRGIPFFSSISGMNRMVKNESKKSTRLCCFHRTPKKCFLILEKIHERA